MENKKSPGRRRGTLITSFNDYAKIWLGGFRKRGGGVFGFPLGVILPNNSKQNPVKCNNYHLGTKTLFYHNSAKYGIVKKFRVKLLPRELSRK